MSFNCLYCDYSGPRPDLGKMPKPSNRAVRMCPSCRGPANPEMDPRYQLTLNSFAASILVRKASPLLTPLRMKRSIKPTHRGTSSKKSRFIRKNGPDSGSKSREG